MSLAVMDQPQGTLAIAHESGTIDVPADSVMRFTEPLWGFTRYSEYALVPAAREGVWWLIAVGDTPCTFVLADPFVVHPAYAIDLGETERAALQLDEPTDALALVMLALPASAHEPVTANLRAPIIFNLRQRRALQIVNRDEAHSLRQPIDLAQYAPSARGVQLV